jgi:ATP sulfurylase
MGEKLISPHGSKALKVLLLEGKQRQQELKRAETLPKLQVSSRETGDLIMMGIGGFTPLEGFMGHDDWKGVCEGMKMTNGIFWPIPITMSQDEKIAAGTEVALLSGETEEIMATMKVTESYKIARSRFCRRATSRPSSRASTSGRRRAGRSSRRRAGRPSRHCSFAIPCTARMSFSPRSQSKSATASTSTSWSGS